MTKKVVRHIQIRIRLKKMKILNKAELQQAEKVLQSHLPKSSKNAHILLYKNQLSFFSTDEKILKKMLTEDKDLDWNKYFRIGGFDIRHATMLKDVTATEGATFRQLTLVHLLALQDPNLLPQLTVNSDMEARISSLNESHVSLVNKTWKFGAPDYRGRGYAKILISTMATRLHAQGYPVYCFIEEENQLSYRLFKKLGFTEDPSYRAAWYEFNY
ncbi:hypothetical protein ANANG_G00304050 [Anguilla anguilla]|uniref:Glycine N-acyltransferase-like protein n=1 Tax=Anguilla anguilla TaxID=7936 RepID=A0A9D3LIJ2_ANGAN|nr:hypothetical protein ANANG_G00304050 [Anguilla anguilla]